MAAGRPHAPPTRPSAFATSMPARSREAACRNHLIPYEMQTISFEAHSDVEMALHGVPYPLVQLGDRRLGCDRFSDSSLAPPSGATSTHDLGHHFALLDRIMSGKAAHRIVRNPQALPSDPSIRAQRVEGAHGRARHRAENPSAALEIDATGVTRSP